MHLIATFTPPDYDAWRTTFDAHAEDRDQSGLSLLQLWRGADAAPLVLALFEVHDRAAATGWVQRQRALTDLTDAQFLRVA